MPIDKLQDQSEHADFEERFGEYQKAAPMWIKVCNEGYKFNNGKHFVELACNSNDGEWTTINGYPIPKYAFFRL